jgi:hypothetical protein
LGPLRHRKAGLTHQLVAPDSERIVRNSNNCIAANSKGFRNVHSSILALVVDILGSPGELQRQ